MSETSRRGSAIGRAVTPRNPTFQGPTYLTRYRVTGQLPNRNSRLALSSFSFCSIFSPSPAKSRGERPPGRHLSSPRGGERGGRARSPESCQVSTCRRRRLDSSRDVTVVRMQRSRFIGRTCAQMVREAEHLKNGPRMIV